MENKPLTAWERVQKARHLKRPTASHVIQTLFPDFLELHGDRMYRDDPSIRGGIALLDQKPITIIAQEKGTQTAEKITRNFGMPHPEGYHKALRLAKQAEKFKRPILFIVDTPGAYPGIGAEERGQANAIAKSLYELSTLNVPTIALILSEGGSGGALAIALCDKTWMFENAIYSILSPEGFASILYKDASLAKEAATVMKLTAQDLFGYGVCDLIIPETKGGLHEEYRESYQFLKSELIREFHHLSKQSLKKRLDNRYLKYRRIGEIADASAVIDEENEDETISSPSQDSRDGQI